MTANLDECRPDAFVRPLIQGAFGHLDPLGDLGRADQLFSLLRWDACHVARLPAIFHLVKCDTTKSEKVSADERTAVSLRQATEQVRIEDTDAGWPQYVNGARSQWLEVAQQMDGKLAGLEATIRLDLVDEALMLASVTFLPTAPMALDDIGTRALRELRLGELHDIIERSLVHLADVGETTGNAVMPYLKAVRARKRRPGRSRTPDLIHADVAAKRVEAASRWPDNAIRMMVKTWPGDFPTVQSADAKIGRAKAAGMLKGRGRSIRLTPRAIELLEGKQP